MTCAIRLNNLTKSFRGLLALNQVSLEVPPGVVVALLGENGAGKTTTLKILLGLLEPDSGEAQVLWLDSRTQGDEIRRRVGYVPERPTLYEWMTVAEHGWFAAGFYPSGYLARYRDLVKEFELPADRRIKELSKGMRAKVALALGMAHEPQLLILDEPTSGLDPLVRREFLESMVDVAAAGRTVLLSSHQIGEVERVADLVAIIKKGNLLAIEKLDDLKTQTRELTLTLNNGAPYLSDVPGQVICGRVHERQWRLLVRHLDESRLESFRSLAQVRDLDIRAPSLEEIFVAYMQADEEPRREKAP
ncbi:MAG: ABC transporter ATP-binding protein [Planctomycetia bacterium]|nr:ABC transporter ATP-binding protein [Planctomycetia bacterium]